MDTGIQFGDYIETDTEEIKKYFDWKKYRRVLKLAKTPGWEDFSLVAKISGAGIALIGFIGFIIFQIMEGFPLIQSLL